MWVEKRGLGTLFINTLILRLRLQTYERKGLEVNSEAKGRHELPPLPVPRAVFWMAAAPCDWGRAPSWSWQWASSQAARAERGIPVLLKSPPCILQRLSNQPKSTQLIGIRLGRKPILWLHCGVLASVPLRKLFDYSYNLMFKWNADLSRESL